MAKKIGVIHGRFQPIHKGHMEYLIAGMDKCDFLYIGITNPDPHLTLEVDVYKARSNSNANPFNYYERLQMIEKAMQEYGIKRNRFEIVPFPINFPELIKYYTPSDAEYYITIYDEWGYHKKTILESLKLKVHVMWIRSMEERFTSGNEVRNNIFYDKNWEELVPKSVVEYIHENDLINRVKKTFQNR